MENIASLNNMSASEIKKYIHDHKDEFNAEERKNLIHLWQNKNAAEVKKQAEEMVRKRPAQSIVNDDIPSYYSTTMENPTPAIRQLYQDIEKLREIYQTKLVNTLMEYDFWKWMLSESTHSSIALEQDKQAKDGGNDADFIRLCRKQSANFEKAFEKMLENAHTEPNLTHDMVVGTASMLMDGIEPEHKNDYRKVSVQMYDLGIAVQNPASIRSRMTALLSRLAKQDCSALKKALDIHYNVIFIQPFIDTNKRTSRLLANYYLIKGGYPPILISPKDQKEYIDVMVELKKTNNPEKYETFMLSCLKHTMEKSIERLDELPRRKHSVPQQYLTAMVGRE